MRVFHDNIYEVEIPATGMRYTLGKTLKSGFSNGKPVLRVISEIVEDRNVEHETRVYIYTSIEGVVSLWKTLVNVPMIITSGNEG